MRSAAAAATTRFTFSPVVVVVASLLLFGADAFTPTTSLIRPAANVVVVGRSTRVLSSAIAVNGDATESSSSSSTTAKEENNNDDDVDIRLNVYEKARTVTSVCTSGTLCTISAHEGVQGAPFGSFVDYVLDDQGNPVFLMNEMSMHTINIKKAQEAEQQDSPAAMVTLFTQLGGGGTTTATATSTLDCAVHKGLQDVSRCSLTGNLVKMDPTTDPQMDSLRMKYSLVHAYADQVMDSPKFAFYRLVPQKVYFVGGFGVLSTWVDPVDYQNAAPDILATEAADICARVNRDHGEDLRLTAQHLLGAGRTDDSKGAGAGAAAIESVRMTSVDRLGMDLRVTAQQGTRRNKLQTDEFRIGFRIPVMSVEDAKSEILKVFQEAWEKGNGVSWGEAEVPGESVPIMKIAADSLE